MKLLIILVCFVTSNLYSQFKLDYKSIKSKYEDYYKENAYIEISKKITEDEIANFFFSVKDTTLVSISLNKSKGYTDIEIEKLIENYIFKFNATKIKTWENWCLYYDQKNKILLIKVFENSYSKKIIQINITAETEIINNMLTLFSSGH